METTFGGVRIAASVVRKARKGSWSASLPAVEMNVVGMFGATDMMYSISSVASMPGSDTLFGPMVDGCGCVVATSQPSMKPVRSFGL